jgi:hypothetical protein
MILNYSNGFMSKAGPGSNYADSRMIADQAHVVTDTYQDSWYKLENESSWISAKYLTIAKNLSPNDDDSRFIVDSNQLSDYEIQMVKEMYNSSYNANSDNIDNMRYLFGAPMQFTELTDPRLSGSKLGRSYLENLIGDSSILTLTPGKAEFMKYFSADATQRLGQGFLSETKEDNNLSINDIITGREAGRYYSFTSDYTEYMKYVNGMCHMAALLLGIGDNTMYDGAAPYKTFNWDLNNLAKKESIMFSFLTTEKSVSFFIDGKQSSFNDGMNNSLGESILASKLANTGSDYAKEALFLFGKSFNDDNLIDTSKQNYENAVSKVLGNLTKNSSVLSGVTSRLGDAATTMIHGGNISFPELWKDSSYNKSYDISIKLASPYGDKESIYLYILVPMFHLMALSFPRQLGSNGYINPFLVRGFCKGWFQTSMGMVDGITIKRASQDGWNKDGLPTEVDVNLSIRDLYQNLTLSRDGDYSTYNNIEYMDMISTWCGVNLNVSEIARKFRIYQMITTNKVTNLIPNMVSDLNQSITDKVRSFIGQR